MPELRFACYRPTAVGHLFSENRRPVTSEAQFRHKKVGMRPLFLCPCIASARCDPVACEFGLRLTGPFICNLQSESKSMTPLPRPALSPCRSQMHPLQGLQRGLTMLTVLACFLGGGMTSTPVWAQSGSKAGNTEFPRLGMWWPDPESQPLREIARYDYVMLFDDQSKFIQPLKAINPNLILLNSTNACEVTYEWPEDDLSKYPAEWFLTQVGSTLTQDVDAATTTFHVVGLSVTEGDNTHSLFIPGDTVLIEGESVLIRSVDAAKRTLTVDRGHVRPASSHKAGRESQLMSRFGRVPG